MKIKIFLFVLLILITLFTRFWQLDNPDPSSDELSYIDDAYLFNIGDARINPRHHMFHHPPPNFPHPFLVNSLIALSMKSLGNTIYAARLPIAIFSSLTVLLIFFCSYTIFQRYYLAHLSAFFSAIIPLNIRYARESYLDAALAFFVILTAFFWLKYILKKHPQYLILTGISLALALSTKITGIFLILPILITGIIFLEKTKKQSMKLLLLLIPFISIFFLFNSPSAYFNGLTFHPNTRTDEWGLWSITKGFFSPTYFNYWLYMFLYNFTIPILLLGISSIFLLFPAKKAVNLPLPLKYIFLFFIFYLPAIVTHLPSSISGPWAYQPELNLLIILATYTFSQFKKYQPAIFILSLLLILPFSIIQGFKILPDPFIKYHNITFNEQNFKKIALDVNNLSLSKPANFSVQRNLIYSPFPEWLFLQSINQKTWLLKTTVDVILTDDTSLKQTLLPNYEILNEYKYKKIPTIYLLKKK